MNLRLDLELILKRHTGYAAAALALLISLGGIGAYVFLTPTERSVSVSVDDDYQVFDERYRAFRTLLIPQQELDARQQAIINAALGHGLQLGRIDYGITPNPQGRYRVATLQFSVRGAYKDFKSFVSEVLAQQPALAVEDMSIQREVKGAQIEARLRLAIYSATGGSRQ